jgi:alpha-tubulin suppressor-like RCC1 family protein
MREWFGGLVMALLFLTIAAPAQETFSATTIADAFLCTGSAAYENGADLTGLNFGAAGTLAIAPASSLKGEFRSVIRFNLAGMTNQFNADLGTNNWAVTNITLQLTSNWGQDGAQPNNPIFNVISGGQFVIEWMSDDTWIEGTGTPNLPTTDGITYGELPMYLVSPHIPLCTNTYVPPGPNVAVDWLLPMQPDLVTNVAAGGDVDFYFYAADDQVNYLFNSYKYGRGNVPLILVMAAALPYTNLPVISAQSANQVAVVGDNTGFSVTASGALFQQWYFDGSLINGATNAVLSLTDVATPNAGNYTLVLTNNAGSITSAVMVLTVVTPPTITAQTVRQVANIGGTVSLAVQAVGAGPLAYQWFKDGRWLAGATNSTLILPGATLANAGIYNVVITNNYRMHLSEPIPVSAGGAGLLAWGLNSYGQLGDGTTTTRTLPEMMVTNAVQAAAGGSHSLFVKSDGTLWAAGYNYYGQLGDGSTTSHLTPEYVGTNVISVAAGYQHSLFITTNGLLYAMGYNSRGQLGDGLTANASLPVSVASNVVAVAAGWYHSVFIESDGTLWAMGRNLYGQLGVGTFVDTNVPVWVASNVVAAAAGGSHSLFITRDQTLWAMGYNASGQLGVNSISETYLPLAVASNVVMAVAGGNFSLFVDTHDVLWGMGDNTYGQLGLGTITGTNQPTAIASNVLAVAAGYEHALFQTTNGVLYGMGLDTYGQLGNAGSVSTNLPTPVPGMALGNVVSGSYADHTLAVGLPQAPVITGAGWQAGSGYAFTVSAFPSNTYWIEAITNLAGGKWQPVSTNTAGANGLLNWQDSQAGKYPERFYRVQQQ